MLIAVFTGPRGTVGSDVMRVLLNRTGYNATDELTNATCVTSTSAHACWLLHDFSDHREDERLDDAQRRTNLGPSDN